MLFNLIAFMFGFATAIIVIFQISIMREIVKGEKIFEIAMNALTNNSSLTVYSFFLLHLIIHYCMVRFTN